MKGFSVSRLRRRRRHEASLEKSGAVICRGDGAALQPAPDAITPARNGAVANITYGARQYAKECGQREPWLRQLSEQGKHCVRTNEDALARVFGVAHDKNGFSTGCGLCRVNAKARK